ncbi:putative reverse transcriptase domain-containing protein [Tanacetum coccineum]
MGSVSFSSSSSSSSDSSSDISSDSLSDSSSGQSHFGPSTRVASPRLVESSVRTTRCSEAFMHWMSAPLYTLYPPTTSESLATLVPSSTPVSRSIAPALADLSPRKRFKDLYSSEVSGEEHMEMGTADAETVTDLGISEGVGAHTEDGIDLDVEVATSDIKEDEEEFEAESSERGTMEIVVDPLATGDISEPTGGDTPDLEGTLYDMSHYMSEVPLDRIIEFETTHRQLEASRERVSLADRVRSLGRENLRVRRDSDDTWRRLRRLESLVERRFRFRRRTMTITCSGMTPEAIEELVNRRVEEALAVYEATHAANVLEAKSQSQNGSDGDNKNGRNGNSGNENGGNGNPKENDRGERKEFIGLIRWLEKMEIVFHISNCLEKYQVKYATCTLLNNALTWWNSHKRTIRVDAPFTMSWRELVKLMAEVYYPRTKIQKMESELWNLTMKNNDLAAYTQRFQ